MTVVAIDFETANAARSSPCAVGLAFVEGGVVTRRAYHLIRPRDMRFDPMNIRVHGIRPRDVEDAPEFPAVFESFADELDGALVLAHNASFDLGVIRETAGLYGLAHPAFASLCTVSVARRLWPDMPSRRLSALAARFEVGFTHHHAGEDAYACARIALEAVRETGAADIRDLAGTTRLAKPVAAMRARASEGIAARAMAARLPRPADGAHRLVVLGSKGTPYDVTLSAKRDGSWRLACSCVGARFRPDCRHVRELSAGDFRNLHEAGPAERAVLAAFVRGRTGSSLRG
ncbi:3'-5' exonuclease [Aureimonas pseudogalii]|uniref:DNA polymerase-3 subunit epsilon n=1 Tax=Aureimonas pseudogalii TaxID=1744844 RepID=A0A7W6H673_9HYPH|nr:3'-5' exonuclease [Aureimonas pseudogalii]MBB3999320.1 DNA polymerase-3 subunit epsilon [Aureimonas pseudogalii]